MAPHRFRSGLHNEQIIRESQIFIDSPFDIHGTTVVGLDIFCHLYQSLDLFVFQTANTLHFLVNIRINRFSFFRIINTFDVLGGYDFVGGFHYYLVHNEFVRVYGARHHRFPQAPAPLDNDLGRIPVGWVYGKHDAGGL